MYRLAFVGVVLMVGAIHSQDAKKDEPKKEVDPIKFNMDYVDKKFGVKFKSARLDGGNKERKQVNILFEFTKDVDNLKEMQDAFTPKAKAKEAALLFYLFDKENIVLIDTAHEHIVGQLTGKAGDSFRLLLPTSVDVYLSDTRKIEVRPNPRLNK